MGLLLDIALLICQSLRVEQVLWVTRRLPLGGELRLTATGWAYEGLESGLIGIDEARKSHNRSRYTLFGVMLSHLQRQCARIVPRPPKGSQFLLRNDSIYPIKMPYIYRY